MKFAVNFLLENNPDPGTFFSRQNFDFQVETKLRQEQILSFVRKNLANIVRYVLKKK